MTSTGQIRRPLFATQRSARLRDALANERVGQLGPVAARAIDQVLSVMATGNGIQLWRIFNIGPYCRNPCFHCSKQRLDWQGQGATKSNGQRLKVLLRGGCWFDAVSDAMNWSQLAQT